MPINLEIPVFSPASALHAQALGAQRIELNARGSYPVGGTTPAAADLEGMTERLTVPVRVMIRPRGKPGDDVDFVYTGDELAAMAVDIGALRGALRAERGDGFVFGVLRRDGEALVVDVERSRQLVEAAGGLACSFHRAFDEAVRSGEGRDVEKAVKDLVACGFEGVLTSGGPGTAATNRAVLEMVVREAGAGGRKLEVIVGGGVRKENVGDVVDGFGDGVWAHSSCYTAKCEEGQIDDEEVMGILERLSGR
ncbi:CutC family protein [Colletotrichum graminicola]|uniref:Copper homeostasis protein cutC homolog n=1 Tax=Colletotrichum graminicola (strain M1.001 / M2 / FGSC 10212) TaxID=645133 RepID=E3QFV1_COLGM|nr:CutC family protein [Colletotrichum graminicola M1.001]EFQ29786.1 CutC family protein [Colletotrichum graminicola M1.001]WDK12418.1 CutC family protein [Colletotrichum graminicola]